jgi:hypothetical protein
MPSDNITLYAGYTVNQYTLQYLNWNGMVLQTAQYAFSADLSFVTPPASPTITGYTFVGWNAILPSNMPANTLSITPIFTINQYSLEYYNYDGALLETIEVDYNADLTFFTGPDTPIKTGYSFAGWDILLPSNMPASNVAITAMYTINQYTLAYVDWDGTILQASDYYYNADLSSVSVPLEPSRTGYTFSGWSKNLPLSMSSSNLTITALYTINQYELEYLDWDGLVIKSSLYDYNLNSMFISAPENPIRIGYTFTGWDITLPENMPASSVRLTATYLINMYTVTYVDWNIAILKSQSFDYDSDISSGIAPNDPVREGYTFTGWDITLPENMPSSNLTITATYKINQYTINYVDWNGLVIHTEIVDYNVELSRILDFSDPFRTGYTFTGWNNLLPENMPANDITITPVYSINQYSIVFMDYNGSILQTSKYDYNEDLSSLIAPEVQERSGLTFVSWNPAIPDKMPAATLVLRATYTDTEVPVISDLEDQNVHLSQVLSFVFPVPIVSDNIDTTPVVEITYYKADGVTILNDIFEAFVELQNGHNIYAVYTARDGSNNESNEVKVVICVIDDINPVVSGVQDSTVYKAGEVLNISFNEGNATLNGNTFVNGSSVDKVGDYTLEVIDEAGNSTTVSFEIKASNQLMLFAIIGLLETLVFLSIYYYVNKEY